LFEILDITAAIKISDIKKAKQLLINEHSYSSYTVYPKTNKKLKLSFLFFFINFVL